MKANLNRLSLAAPENCVQKNGAKRRWRSRANWLGSSWAGGQGRWLRGRLPVLGGHAVHSSWLFVWWVAASRPTVPAILHGAARHPARRGNDCGAGAPWQTAPAGQPPAAIRCLSVWPDTHWLVASNTAWSASSKALATAYQAITAPTAPPAHHGDGAGMPGPAPPAGRRTAPRPRAAGCPCGPIPARQQARPPASPARWPRPPWG